MSELKVMNFDEFVGEFGPLFSHDFYLVVKLNQNRLKFYVITQYIILKHIWVSNHKLGDFMRYAQKWASFYVREKCTHHG